MEKLSEHSTLVLPELLKSVDVKSTLLGIRQYYTVCVPLLSSPESCMLSRNFEFQVSKCCKCKDV